ncbi:hypothetical protein [Parapedobacter tibetensis]|uniref:hypothetical protein n=1 Tax=Parapedobacter tibetensis TaxID=2972951 RepID=UPI00214D40F8|nr:hypothetical protein [Parapedobacter tibetensis]
MDFINIRYEKLFSIFLAHADFPVPETGKNWMESLAEQLSMEPDEKTKQLFTAHDIHCRFNYNTLTCYIRVMDNENKPFHRLTNDFSARFILNASRVFMAGLAVSPVFGKDHIYHFPIKLKTTASSTILKDNLLSTVASNTPDHIFHQGEPGHWELQAVNIAGCFGVIDVIPEGSSKNRLFKNEATQVLNYTVANGKANEHLYRITFKS